MYMYWFMRIRTTTREMENTQHTFPSRGTSNSAPDTHNCILFLPYSSYYFGIPAPGLETTTFSMIKARFGVNPPRYTWPNVGEEGR